MNISLLKDRLNSKRSHKWLDQIIMQIAPEYWNYTILIVIVSLA